MSDDGDSDGFDLSSALESGAAAVRETVAFLGVEREAHVCPDCQVACERSYAHDPARMAFDGGESPTWYCAECETHYVRERTEEAHAVDLYGRE